MELLLTRTELSILQMRCQGLQSKQIADVMGQCDSRGPDALMVRARRRNKIKTSYQLIYEFATNPYKITNQHHKIPKLKGKNAPTVCG